MVQLAPTKDSINESAPTTPLDMEWMFEHSKQARRMLPGGVTVIAAFFVSFEEIFRLAKKREFLSSLGQFWINFR